VQSSLALKYRPRRFGDLVGQRPVQAVLRQMVADDAVPPALLFDGSRGTGKTTTLRILAAALNCEAPPDPCGQCVSCKAIFEGNSFDLREIDAASNGLVDDIRAIRQEVLYATGGIRVVGFDEAQSMSGAAFNAALKMIEEPPQATVFVLLTTEPGRIPETVASRCNPFRFRRIGVGDIVARLTHICDQEALHVDSTLLHLIADRADGGMRNAIMTLDQITRAGITTVTDYHELLGETDYAPELLAAIISGDLAATFAGLDTQMARTGDPATVTDSLGAALRDILILNAGGTLTCQGSALTARQELATRIGTAQAVSAAKILWDLKTKVRPGESPRAGLDLAVVMLSELFAHHTRRQQPTTPPTQPGRKLTLAEMAALHR
jgi:DNA polymerase III subunit gamma/tau